MYWQFLSREYSLRNNYMLFLKVRKQTNKKTSKQTNYSLLLTAKITIFRPNGPVKEEKKTKPKIKCSYVTR